jgi:transcriptional antiterminator RfaH
MAQWFVARAHANAKSKARVNLVRQGYEGYLPLCRRTRTHARRQIVQRPLFPGYLFVSFEIESTAWRSIFSTIGVVKPDLQRRAAGTRSAGNGRIGQGR